MILHLWSRTVNTVLSLEAQQTFKMVIHPRIQRVNYLKLSDTHTNVGSTAITFDRDSQQQQQQPILS